MPVIVLGFVAKAHRELMVPVNRMIDAKGIEVVRYPLWKHFLQIQRGRNA